MVVRQRHMLGMVVAVLVLAGVLLVVRAGDQGQRIGTSGAIIASAGVTGVMEPSIAEPPPAPATTSTVAPSPAAPVPQSATTTTVRRAVVTTIAARASVTTTTAPAPTAAAAGLTTASVPATVTTQPAVTTTTVDPCRNSTDSRCGSFRFDPQPGADTPMTVGVAVEPASPAAGQPVVSRITLTDPDGVSYDGTNFNFGNSGIGGSTPEPCAKFGPWDPPARNPASATETREVGHTYFEAGTYTATFFFDAGPFDCVDSVSGRGDRPYASSATGRSPCRFRPS